jgi:hypothetical protein
VVSCRASDDEGAGQVGGEQARDEWTCAEKVWDFYAAVAGAACAGALCDVEICWTGTVCARTEEGRGCTDEGSLKLLTVAQYEGALNGKSGECSRFEHEVRQGTRGRVVECHVKDGAVVGVCVARSGGKSPAVRRCVREAWIGRRTKSNHAGEAGCVCAACYTKGEHRKEIAKSMDMANEVGRSCGGAM